MSSALAFKDRDYAAPSSFGEAGFKPDAAFARRLVAEVDDLPSLMLWLASLERGERPEREHHWSRDSLLGLLSRSLIALDQCLNAQLNAILHHPQLQALEANWRGVWLLAEQAAEDDSEGLVIIRVLDLGWATLRKDLSRAMEFDQSHLFERIYSREFGHPGGTPFGLLLGAWSLSHRGRGEQATLDVLPELAQLAAAAFAPLILNAAPALFGVDRFAQLSGVSDLENHFQQPELARWQALRRTEDARFMGFALPRMLMRGPWPENGQGPEGFHFRETMSCPDKDGLWGHACFAMGIVAIRAFCQSGWFAQIRGFRPGRIAHGVVDNLPRMQPVTATGALYPQPSPVDWLAGERMERLLSDQGFITLMPLPNTPMLVLHSVPSVQQPAPYDALDARVSARLSAMLHYTLCVSRFAHYLKVMGRDRIGGYRTPEECESQMQRWLHRYTMATEDASDELRARFPLRSASVVVRARPGEPGHYYSVIRLQPHFQLDQLVTSMRLITELTPVS